MKKYIPFLLPLIFFLACIPDPVEIEVPQAETKLVIASQMLFNQAVLVQVSKSFNAITEIPTGTDTLATEGDSIDEEFLNLLLADSARVIIEGPEGPDTLVSLSQGFYLSFNTDLIENETYRLTVFDSSTQQSVFAQTEVKPQVAFKKVDFGFRKQEFTFNDTTFIDSSFQLIVEFDDLPDENYYMVNLYRISQNGQQPTGNLFSFNQGQPTFTYTDALLNGPTFFDTLEYGGIGLGDTVGVTLSHISRDYYEFLLARERSGTSFFVSLLGEPVSFPSNVEGGYGMFTMHFPTTEVFVVE